MTKIEGGTKVRRRGVAAISVDSQQGVHTAEVEKVIVQSGAVEGGLSEVGPIQ